MVIGLRVNEEEEIQGLDLSQHSESATACKPLMRTSENCA